MNPFNWFSDPEDSTPSFLKLTRNILIFTIIISVALLALASGFVVPEERNIFASWALIVALFIETLSLALVVLRKQTLLAKIVIPPALFAAGTLSAIGGDGFHDISILSYPAIVVIASLLLRNKAIWVAMPIALAGIGYVAYYDMAGYNDAPLAEYTAIDDALAGAFLVILATTLVQLLLSRLEKSLNEAKSNELAQIDTNQKLMDLQNSLENRIIERTKQLSELNRSSERSNRQFQTISQISRLIVNIREAEDLPMLVSRIISERFNFYHTGIFLLDDAKEFAILIAANSEGGERMLERGYRLRVAETSVVGYASSKGIARIALDTGTDAVYFNNSDLPETRSELAIPLQIGNSVIGVLDVQSTEPDAFIQEDIDTLTTLADQVAVSIRNAQLYRDTAAAVAESQMLFGTMVKKAWKSNTQSNQHIGYRFNGTAPVPLDKPLTTPEARAAFETGTVSSGSTGTIAIPLKLRDEIIGIINVNAPSASDVGEDELDILRAAAERIALALENSALLEESQKRAAREQIIGEISSKIGSSVEIESILRTAVRELGSQIGDAQISVEIGGVDE